MEQGCMNEHSSAELQTSARLTPASGDLWLSLGDGEGRSVMRAVICNIFKYPEYDSVPLPTITPTYIDYK